MWADARFVQGEKNIGGKGREGSFQGNQHPTGFIGSADNIIFQFCNHFVTNSSATRRSVRAERLGGNHAVATSTMKTGTNGQASSL